MHEADYYDQAIKYLLTFEGITPEILGLHLYKWEKPETNQVKSMQDLFRAFLDHAKNKVGMPNSIGDINRLKGVLYDFDHLQTIKKYPDWEAIFDAIKKHCRPPGKMDKTNKKSHWVSYSKSIISIADFLTEYKTKKEFDDFVAGFLKSEESRLALPLLLSAEIHGFGFALACDFLKENVSPEFVKPDTHIKDIAERLEITTSKSDYKVFKDLVAYALRIGKRPYSVDKVFWLIGSGRFEFCQPSIKIKPSKSDYIACIKNRQSQSKGPNADSKR